MQPARSLARKVSPLLYPVHRATLPLLRAVGRRRRVGARAGERCPAGVIDRRHSFAAASSSTRRTNRTPACCIAWCRALSQEVSARPGGAPRMTRWGETMLTSFALLRTRDSLGAHLPPHSQHHPRLLNPRWPPLLSRPRHPYASAAFPPHLRRALDSVVSLLSALCSALTRAPYECHPSHPSTPSV